jgi:CcmD family protein
MTPKSMKRMMWWLLFMVGMAGMNALVLAQPGQTEFVPVTELPASEQLPAAPLLIAAYAFVWIAVLAYLWLIWRRLAKVEQEIGDLSSRLAKRRP